jgi:putative membrane protein
MYNYQNPMMNANDYGWGFGMAIVYLVILALIVTVGVQILRGHHHHIETSKPTPLEIVSERYARGEIKKDEFEQLSKDLK